MNVYINNKIKTISIIIVCILIIGIGIFGFQKVVKAERINPTTDLEYLGAFRLPNEQSNNTHWEYGGHTLAFRPDGDPGGPNDGFPGSLFSVGKTTGGLLN